MKSSSSGNVHFLKIDKGEDVLQVLTSYINEAGIKSGSFSAIGVLCDVELGYYELDKANYIKKTFNGDYELLSMIGNVGELNGKQHPHIHVVIGDSRFNCFGGHLLGGKVGITCEIFITSSEMILSRVYDDKMKLNLLSPLS